MSNPVIIWRRTKTLHKFLNLQGRILVWTIIHVAPAGFEQQTPYISGIVELDNKEKITVEIVDVKEEELKVGQKVKTVIRRIGQAGKEDVIEYGIKVKPI